MTAPAQPSDYTSIITQYLNQWGLQSLAPLVDSLGRSGAGNDEISLRIQDSPEYKTRFAGNQARVAAGLAPLDPASYIALEGQYRQITSQLPSGFYDDKASTDAWIGGDVSPSELSQRVQDANQAYVLAPQGARDAWAQYNPGAGDAAHAVAAILDTNVAEPLIQQRVAAAGIGGAALSSGLQLTSQSLATQAAQQGVTIDQARQAYQQIASRMAPDQSIGGRFGGGQQNGPPLNQTTEEQAVLLGDAGAQNRLNTAYASESALFHGHGAASDNTGSTGSNY